MPFVLLLLVGLTHFAQALQSGTVLNAGPIDPTQLFHRFFPSQVGAEGGELFAPVQGLLTGIARHRAKVSLVALLAFLWFSTRLFAGVRTALNDVFDVSARPLPAQHLVVTFLLGKARDALMVVAMLILFLINTTMTAGLAYFQSRGPLVVPELKFFVSTFGRVLGEGLAFAFQISLFYVVYSYASVRRLPWRTALLAATFSSCAFEVAKRLYGLYLAHFASLEGPAGDAKLAAIVLFVLWVYYTAIVFLLGGVVAETWELRKLQQRQRAILA